MDWVQPPTCAICDLASAAVGTESDICPRCDVELPRVAVVCRRCADLPAEPHSDSRSPGCALCRVGGLTVRVRHFGWHAESLRALILRAKWHQEWSLIRMLGRWLAEVARSENYAHGLDGWVAVPRDLRRRLLHGKPLAEHLAAEVGRRLHLPRIAAPRRARRTPQVALGAIARRRNLRGAFSVSARGRQRIRDRGVLLIDDVITTGSTIEECARALLDAGAREVRALVLAVAPDPESDRGR